jgi:hypothetical protein
MRILATIIGALTVIVMAAQTRAMDWDILTINKPPDAEATVSFSIGYPKGWLATQDYGQERRDIYKDIVVPAGQRHASWICSFAQPSTTNAFTEQGYTCYEIWPTSGATAKDAAESFFADKRNASVFTQKSIAPIKTRAGESGWLLESEGYLLTDPAISKLMFDPTFLKNTNGLKHLIQLEKNLKPSQKTPIMYHDFFFRPGNRGAIRIEIWTQTANASWRSRLDHMVLETLRFNGS